MKQKMRDIPYAMEQEAKAEIAKYLQYGVISPTQSDWASPLVLVPKPDGSLRVCINFQVVNRMTKVDSYNTPKQKVLLSKLGSAKYLSSFDLTSGYWNIPMEEESKDITTFTCPEGLFRFEVLPFGLASAGAEFCRLIHEVYKPYIGKFILAYVDDIVVF
ncbi:MAG: RNA-directed DNA polymerase, partial [Desulfobacteraceae bacterium]|nr:RNA-directed DNA polymerase [Desulfobacteraceae bacterium]